MKVALARGVSGNALGQESHWDTRKGERQVSKKITIIGGGSSTFTPQLMQLFIRSQFLQGSTIVLMDVDERRLEVMDTLSRQLVALTDADLKVESTTKQRESLAGADFVITAISVGGMDAWEKDIEIPATYGIYMPIADSIGPGGMMRAFRHVPVLAGVARDVAEVAPRAWIFNYTNPLTVNCLAMRRAAPVETVGLCTCSSIPRFAPYLGAALDVAPEELALPALAAGLNHCAAIVELRFTDGRDALPRAKERIEDPVMRWGLEIYGILPYCAGHWTEFYPSLTRLAEPYRGRLQGLRMQFLERVHDMTHERERSQHWAELATRLARGEETLDLNVLPQDEMVQVVQIMEALLTNSGEIHAVNVPNRSAIPNLPADAVVEVSTLVNRYGLRPLQVGPLPEAVAANLRLHIAVQQLTVEAALTGDRQVALQAFLQDPQIAARLTPAETGKLLDELLRAHARDLPQFA